MSAIPYGPAFDAWVNAYGREGEPAPIPTDPELIGGTHHGERIHVLADTHIVELPVRDRSFDYYSVPDAPVPATFGFRVERYDKRTLLSCWSAAPVRRLVHSELSDDHAMARLQESRVTGAPEADVDAEWARVQYDEWMRRLHELRDSLRDSLGDA